MRGHDKDFIRLKEASEISFFVLSQPTIYSSHFIDVGGYASKRNCHEGECPFCEKGIIRRRGMYTIILAEGGVIGYFDIGEVLSAYMLSAAQRQAENENAKEEFPGMDLFLDNHLVVIKRPKGKPFDYEVSYEYVDVHTVNQMKTQLGNSNSELSKEYIRLLMDFPDLSRPGSYEEDKEIL